MPLPTWLTWKVGAGALAALAALLLVRRAVSGGADKPARQLTLAEAQDLMQKYANAGVISIYDDGSGRIDHRMSIGSTVAGVDHNYLTSVGDNSRITHRDRIDNLDPRFGVYLVRLSQLMRAMGVDEMLDAGITHGGSNPNDVHNQGRAIDVVGLRNDRGDLDLNVLRDWGNKPDAGSGNYRLQSGDPGWALFQAIYRFAAVEGSDRSEKVGPDADNNGLRPTEIGESGYILTPDHPNAKLRADHKNHMHLQLGRTQGVES